MDRWKKLGLLLVICTCLGATMRAESTRCSICGGPYDEMIYTMTDKVTREKREMCHKCSLWPDDCYLCGLPAIKNFTKLADGRFICERDVKSVVLDKAEALQICTGIGDTLNQTFSRFMTFPETNVDVRIVDRIDLLSFKVPGNDYACPNILGYIGSETNDGKVLYPMRLMSALPRAEFKSTCAHEFTHAWVFQNVPPARRKTLGHDAHEGFCELIAYLLMETQQETKQMQVILDNSYTRGQVNLFIEAAGRYGLNDVVDWMKYGEDKELRRGQIDRVRNVEMPSRPPSTNALSLTVTAVARAPDTLILRSISLGQAQPFALINNLTLAVGETGKARVGDTNVLIRCLAIGKNSVRIRIESSGDERELHFKSGN